MGRGTREEKRLLKWHIYEDELEEEEMMMVKEEEDVKDRKG